MSRGRRRNFGVILGAIVVTASLASVFYLSLSGAPTGESPGLAYHSHTKLTIHNLRTGTNLTIPGNIGLPGGLWVNRTLDSYGGSFAPIHTQDTDGIMHVEPTKFRVFTIADFFFIWGVPFDQTCVWDYCAGDGRAPPIMATKFNGWLEGLVDSKYPLRNGDEILILIGAG